MTSESETLHSPLSRSEPLARSNSPIAYGLGSFGLESAYKVFWGFYLFYYVDVLGLAVALAGLANLAVPVARRLFHVVAYGVCQFHTLSAAGPAGVVDPGSCSGRCRVRAAAGASD